ncbi:MAG: rhamnulokinase family protein [Anaerolineales bacterium]
MDVEMKESSSPSFLALDLGAESGRAVIGHLQDDRLQLKEVHRFANGPVRIGDSLHWDVLRLWTEILNGITLAAQEAGKGLMGLGLDTWGVDFGLLARDDTLLGNPYHYRDRRTEGMLEIAFRRVPRTEIYERTGIQFMQLNSLYQLLAMAQAKAPALSCAQTFLTMPDLFNFWFTGRKAGEYTIATTTQCFDPRAGDWARDLVDRLDIPSHIFPPIVAPGTVLGELRASVAEDARCSRVPVIAIAAHDTQSAVAAVPCDSPDCIYLSSGTWSLMGVEVHQPVITADSLDYDFTNEGGVGGTICLLKNIPGLWLVQECRRSWAQTGQEYSYDDLSRMAGEAPALGSLVVPFDSRFQGAGDMPGRIQAFCRETVQPIPESPGEITRCALESLALEYRWVAERLDALLGQRRSTVLVVGGGSRNRLLNQFTADATERRVVTGPVEATALGSVLVQAVALGHLSSLSEGRALVKRSFEETAFQPRQEGPWEAAYERYLQLRSRVTSASAEG